MKKQLVISALIILFILIGTALAVFYGKGYRFNFSSGQVEGTGLLVATSTPDGASVYIDGHLTTATDNTINLAPGEYNVKIQKEGYFSWEKKIHVEKEVVAKAQATLFPTAPKLESITSLGVWDPVIDPSYTKIAFTVSSQSAKTKNGIYILDMGNRSLLTLQTGATQIVDDTLDTFSDSALSWSPDGKNLLATISAPLRPTTYLLDATTFNNAPRDVTETLSSVQQSWNKLKQEKATARLQTLKTVLRNFAVSNFSIMDWSPDETKILYTASASATIPQIIKPALIGTDSTPQVRDIQVGNVYVYDTKEDKNYLISSIEDASTSKILWFPDSTHLIVVHNKRVDIREYDNTNNILVYAGPFIDSYVFPWPSADQIVVSTNLGNPDIAPNLYTISLK